MRRRWLGIFGLVAITYSFVTPSSLLMSQVSFKGSKGVNLHNWFTWTPQISASTYRLPVFVGMPGALTIPEAKRLRIAGFDFVRLTVDPGVFMLLSGPSLRQATDALLAGIDSLQAAGLSVIVDMHPISRVHPDPASAYAGVKALEGGVEDPTARRFENTAAALAKVLDDHYGRASQIAFELLNEPDLPCGAPSWRNQQAALLHAVRDSAPRLTLILTGSCWGGIDGLVALEAADYPDSNTIYSFHFYDPYRFTHQGTKTDDINRYTSGLPYPTSEHRLGSIENSVSSRLPPQSSDTRKAIAFMKDKYLSDVWDFARVDAQMERVAAWARDNNVLPSRILMGEFGVNADRNGVPGAHAEDRMRWLTDVRRAAEARGFRWAMWLYRGNNKGGDEFDLVIDGKKKLDQNALSALGLQHTQ